MSICIHVKNTFLNALVEYIMYTSMGLLLSPLSGVNPSTKTEAFSLKLKSEEKRLLIRVRCTLTYVQNGNAKMMSSNWEPSIKYDCHQGQARRDIPTSLPLPQPTGEGVNWKSKSNNDAILRWKGGGGSKKKAKNCYYSTLEVCLSLQGGSLSWGM